ncbi:MAG TPA: GNAT family N-acetyltransferase [Longimicrobium sp.]|nr:GNAT family N-acetyltransferase [Longimicrobium sp.]
MPGDRGYPTQMKEAIARETGLPVAEVEKVLRRLQASALAARAEARAADAPDPAGYRISGYAPNDRRAVAHLQRLLWRGGPRGNAAYLEWKYHRNPYLDPRYLVLAWEGDELAGMIGAFGALWQAPGGERMMLPCLADTVVEVSRRGGPLFARMLDELLARLRADRVPWLLDFGDQPAGAAMLMRGWKAVGPWAVAAATRQGPAGEHRSWLYRPLRDLRGTRSGVPIRTALRPAAATLEAIAELVERLPPHPGVRHVRDVEYLAWRGSNPLAQYFYLTAGPPRRPEGYLVAHRARVDPQTRGRLAPTTIMECDATSDAVWMDLLEAAQSLLPGGVLLMWARDVAPARLDGLPALGFTLDAPTGRLTHDAHLPNLLVHPVAELPPESPFARLDTPAAWDLRAVCGRSWR